MVEIQTSFDYVIHDAGLATPCNIQQLVASSQFAKLDALRSAKWLDVLASRTPMRNAAMS
jgi:hypothetical protein